MKLGFIGTGNMGEPMARNLIEAGHELTVYNRHMERLKELEKVGARIVDSPSGVCQEGLILTMLSDDAAYEEILFGGGRVIESLSSGAIHLCMSTISPKMAMRLAQSHREKGISYISAPVFGRPDAAASAKLFIVAAGDKAAFETCQPLFEAMGQRTFFMGNEPAAANIVKLTGNFLIASVIESLGEAFALIRKNGIAPDVFLDVLTNTLFPTPLYRNYGGIIMAEKYEPPGFRLPLGLKDVRLLLEVADASAVPMPLASLMRDHLISAIAHGYDGLDWSGIARVLAENAGLEAQR